MQKWKFNLKKIEGDVIKGVVHDAPESVAHQFLSGPTPCTDKLCAVQSWIVPIDNHPYAKRGDWDIALRVKDPALLEQIRKGQREINIIDNRAEAVTKEEVGKMQPFGETESNQGDTYSMFKVTAISGNSCELTYIRGRYAPQDFEGKSICGWPGSKVTSSTLEGGAWKVRVSNFTHYPLIGSNAKCRPCTAAQMVEKGEIDMTNEHRIYSKILDLALNNVQKGASTNANDAIVQALESPEGRELYRQYHRAQEGSIDTYPEPVRRLEAIAKGMVQKDSSMTEAQAFVEACKQYPHLYMEYRRLCHEQAI
jgi:hypothetical protein